MAKHCHTEVSYGVVEQGADEKNSSKNVIVRRRDCHISDLVGAILCVASYLSERSDRTVWL